MIPSLFRAADIIGKINAPVKVVEGANPVESTANLFGTFFSLFMTVASLSAFVYLLWGVYDWITSGGETDKLAKARTKIIQAIVGMIVLIVVLVFYFAFLGGFAGVIKIQQLK